MRHTGVELFTADRAHDKMAVDETLVKRGAKVVVPPIRKARISRSNTSAVRARNRTVEAVRELGRREWKKRTGSHQQGRVENAFYRNKSASAAGSEARTSRRGRQKPESRSMCSTGCSRSGLRDPSRFATDRASGGTLRPEPSCDNAVRKVPDNGTLFDRPPTRGCVGTTCTPYASWGRPAALRYSANEPSIRDPVAR